MQGMPGKRTRGIRVRATAEVIDRADLTRFGIAVGHATDEAGATGLTVIRGVNAPLRAGFAVLGRATGSRDLLAASPDHLVGGRVDAVMLTGGSAYGLDAAAGVMRWMEERGRGFPVGAGVVPIVPAAVVFDLSPLGRFDARPTPSMAYEATERAASVDVAEGSVGVGAGTTVGKIRGVEGAMKGGFGVAIEESSKGDVAVAAMCVVNAVGDVRDAHGQIIAGARAPNGGFVDAARVLASGAFGPSSFGRTDTALRNTTLAVVATSSPFDSATLMQLARAAGAALFRRITPVGTVVDGDVVFALSPETPSGDNRPAVDPRVAEALAVAALERAIERAVRLARGRDGIPGLADPNGR